jgi:hypothetical protein
MKQRGAFYCLVETIMHPSIQPHYEHTMRKRNCGHGFLIHCFQKYFDNESLWFNMVKTYDLCSGLFNDEAGPGDIVKFIYI